MSNIGSPYNHNAIMQKALLLAAEDNLVKEIPVAAIIVDSNSKEIISFSKNLVESEKNSILHAEIVAINKACKFLGKKYLDNCEIYITLEPCMMCYAAISYTRISKIYFAAFDNKSTIKHIPKSFYKPEIYGGIMEQESQNLLSKFFKDLREKE